MRLSSLALSLAFAVQLAASVAVKMDLPALSRAADKVIGGEVVAMEPERDPDNGYIYTRVTVAVERAADQSLEGQQYSFRMIGGELDGKRISIQGLPRIDVGDDVILFLTSRSDSVMGPTVGLWQGVYFVADGAVLNHSKKAVALTAKGAAAIPSLRQEDAADADAFFERVRSYR